MLEKTNLFEARTNGYHNYRVPGILCTQRGVILATVEARRDTGGDWGDNDILLRLIASSPDGAHNWQIEKWDESLREPVCMGSLLRLSQQSAQGTPLIIFANPDNLENELTPMGHALAHDRKRLTVQLSADDCESWTVSRVLEPGPSGYSDLAQANDGTLLCLYENGMVERMTDTRYVTVARFDLAWLRGNER